MGVVIIVPETSSKKLKSVSTDRGVSRVFVEEGFDLCLSGLCVPLARYSYSS